MSALSRAFLPAGLAVGLVPSAAFAHVTVEPKAAPAGEETKLTFRVPHGCDGSATTGFHVQIPGGVTDVKPKVHAGWTIAVKSSDVARPSADGKGIDAAPALAEVAWTGGPLPDAYMDEFEMAVKLPAKAGETLTFAVTQDCEKGSRHDRPTVHVSKS